MRELIAKKLKESFSLFRKCRIIQIIQINLILRKLKLHDDHPFARVRTADNDIAEQTRLLAQIKE